ncbi:unnamed protein product, partial [Amoebophrya sp. A25]
GSNAAGPHQPGIVYSLPGKPLEIDSLVLQGEFTKLSVMVFGVSLDRNPTSYEDRKASLPFKCMRQPLTEDDLDVECIDEEDGASSAALTDRTWITAEDLVE